MSDVVYRPGEWQVVVEQSGIAALPADASPDKVVALSEMLSGRVPELTEAIDVLSGGAITGLGSFAVALIGDTGTRFAVRGAVTVTTGLEQSFSGEDITTWSERFIPGDARFEITFGEPVEEFSYPIRSGVVLASGIRVGEEFAPEPEAEPETDAAADAVVPADEEGVVADADVEGDAAAEADATDADEAEASAEASGEPETASEDEVVEADDAATDDVPYETIAPDDLPATAPVPAEDAQTEDAPAEDAPAEDAPADDPAPSETITPDELGLVRASADETASELDAAPEEAAPADVDDLHATIAPPSFEAPPVPAPFPPAPDEYAVVPPPPAPGAQPAPAAPPAPASGLDIGDHDGSTISLAEARRLRASSAAPDAPTEVMPVIDGPAHDTAALRIRLSTGQQVDLDRPVIIGRKPRSTRASGTTLPHLIAVESPSSDISRNHLEVRPEGDSVVVIDLHTTNGSTLLRPGADPVRLHPGEQTLVLGGDVIDVGDGVTVTVEEL